MAQFEAQADKAAANSKAAREAKSKESKEEREKREKYEKLMKKAEEMTTAKNYREALNLLGQAKSHANEAQLKGIEEKIQAVDKEMNKGSLFDLMERQPQPEQQPVRQPLQPHPHYASQNTGSGQDMYGMPPATGGWQDESFLQEDEQQQLYFSDSEQPAYNPKDYEDYIDFPQSMLEPKYSPYQTR